MLRTADSADYVRDAHSGIRAPVAAGLPEALAPLLLEHANLRSARLAVDDADHAGVGDKGCSGEHLAAVLFEKEHLVEGDFLADLSLEAIDGDHRARVHLHLAPARLNDCEQDFHPSLPTCGAPTDGPLCFYAKELG